MLQVLMLIAISLSVTKSENCPPIIYGDNETTTIAEGVLMNLNQEGPSDGECEMGNKWLVLGEPHGMSNKCVCLNIPQGSGMI